MNKLKQTKKKKGIGKKILLVLVLLLLLIGGIFTVLWILIKLAIVIAVLFLIGSFIYSKIKGEK